MIDDVLIQQAASFLRDGRVVAIPTETVYGLAANALDMRAVARVFDLKSRPRFDPLIVHLLAFDQLSDYVTKVPANAQKLAELFWPGPLTMILPKKPIIADLVTSGLPFVAIRIPSHPVARKILASANMPLAAPSANRFGCISPTTAKHVYDEFGDEVDLIVDGGPCQTGVESTVISFATNPPSLLRAGGLAKEAIEAAIGPLNKQVNQADKQVSPGTLKRHYAPRTPLMLMPRDAKAPKGKRVGLLTLSVDGFANRSMNEPNSRQTNSLNSMPNDKLDVSVIALNADVISSYQVVCELSKTGNLVEAASKLFAAMRELDQAKLDLIYAHRVPKMGLGLAINDRLKRAAYTQS